MSGKEGAAAPVVGLFSPSIPLSPKETDFLREKAKNSQTDGAHPSPDHLQMLTSANIMLVNKQRRGGPMGELGD